MYFSVHICSILLTVCGNSFGIASVSVPGINGVCMCPHISMRFFFVDELENFKQGNTLSAKSMHSVNVNIFIYNYFNKECPKLH